MLSPRTITSKPSVFFRTILYHRDMFLVTFLWVPGIKTPGREADHSSPFSAEVTNAWSYTSTLPTRLHGAMLS